jgi:hypothetical protein
MMLILMYNNRSTFPLYLCHRFPDCDCTVQIPQEDFQNKDIARVWEPGYEDKVSRKNDLNVRTSWKVTGKQFFISERYIVSVGILDHGELTMPVLEITDSISDGSSCSGVDVKASYKLIDQLVSELLLHVESKVQLKGFIKDFGTNTDDDDGTSSRFDLIDRSVQWVKALKALEGMKKDQKYKYSGR